MAIDTPVLGLLLSCGAVLVGITKFFHDRTYGMEKDFDKRADALSDAIKAQDAELRMLAVEVRNQIARHDAWLHQVQQASDGQNSSMRGQVDSYRHELGNFQRALTASTRIELKEFEQKVEEFGKRVRDMENFLAKELSFKIRQG